jgi:hypothetical protein
MGTLRVDLAGLLVVHALSRAAYRLAGGRFDARELGSFWHFLPIDLLEHRLAESLFYSHFQPPLYNLYLGLTLRAFGDTAPLAFSMGSFFAGAAGIVCLYVLMRRLGAARGIALGTSAFFWLSPAALLFETFLFYTLPLTVALLLAALALHAAVVRERAIWWAAFFGVLAAIVLARALFHPLWLVVICGICTGACHRAQRPARLVLAGAALPLALVLAVCVKNWIVFDSFGTTTWLGFGLARMTVRSLPDGERERWIAGGRLSPFSRVRPPGAVRDYLPLLPAAELEPTGVPLLDRPEKPGGDLNLFHAAYAPVSQKLRNDALVVLRERPAIYAATAWHAFGRFLGPASSWHPLAQNRAQIAPYADGYDAVFHFAGLFDLSGLLLVLVPALVVWAAFWTWRCRRGEAKRWLGAFMLGTVAYVAAAGCLFEPNENMRFRFMIEPYLWAFAAVFLTDVVERRAHS